MTIFTWENFFVLALIRAYLIIISVDYSVVEESQKKFSAVWREGGGEGVRKYSPTPPQPQRERPTIYTCQRRASFHEAITVRFNENKGKI